MHYGMFFLLIVFGKLNLLLLTWAFALCVSLGLRIWGFQHPEPFEIRPYLVSFLLFGPPFLLLLWIGVTTVQEN